MTRICVVGLGKMGLPIAVLFASRGHMVVGADINPQTVAAINAGQSPITNEPGIAEMIAASVADGCLRAMTATDEAVAASEVVIVLVPLLVDPDAGYAPTYSAMDQAMEAIGHGLRPGTLVIIETTLPVGDTRQRLGPIIERTSGLRMGDGFLLAFSPERVQSNSVIKNLLAYPKVVGGIDLASTTAAVAFYRECLTENVLPVADCETAEFAKIAECIYRDVNIALANELAISAAESGVDINEVIAAANSEPLSHIHRPGLGVGGHCIPVYPYFMIQRQGQAQLAQAARRINDEMADYAAHVLSEELETLEEKTVVILGLSYRANVKEATFSSALLVARALRAAGARVLILDPLFTPEEIASYGLEATGPLPRDVPPVDAIVVQAWHAIFTTIRWSDFAGKPVVLDGRHALEKSEVTASGLRYLAIGQGERAMPIRVK